MTTSMAPIDNGVSAKCGIAECLCGMHMIGQRGPPRDHAFSALYHAQYYNTL